MSLQPRSIQKHLQDSVFEIDYQARKPRNYTCSKLRPTDHLNDLTGVKCRATSVAKNALVKIAPKVLFLKAKLLSI